ncbi:hypothetical protein ABTX60_33705 [Streptomyces sp. NPDC126510]|uniref:hypothetical protein n=1 Tax=Streptomyces sp. NPDC126510 TaxID=3155317 RepID=UPI003333E742
MCQQAERALERRAQGEILRVEPWGPHAVRVRAAADTVDDEANWALDLPPVEGAVTVLVRDDGTARLVNGRITVEADPDGRLRFLRSGETDGLRELLAEKRPHHGCPGPRAHTSRGDGTEVWSYGEQAYPILRDHLLLRERLRPYLNELAETAHRTGAPPMRPLFFDFPGDETAWDVDDQYMLGPDVLVAPITEAGVRERTVYLPSGSRWCDAATGTEHEGGASVSAAAPLERVPVLVRAGARVRGEFDGLGPGTRAR